MKLDFDKIQKRVTELKKQYYTLEMLAKDLGVTHSTVNSWKTSKTSPRLKDMEKIKKIGKFDSLDEIVC